MTKKDAPRFVFEDYMGTLIETYEDVAACKIRLGPDRKRRLEILSRLTVLMQIASKDVNEALFKAARALDKAEK